MRHLFYICLLITVNVPVTVAQDYTCEPTIYDYALSQRLANYKMTVKLDPDAKRATGTSLITWVNNSPDTIYEVRLYMYLNAFAGMESSMLRERRGAFGQDLSDRTPIEWGGVTITNPVQANGSGLLVPRYIQPTDENEKDKSVVEMYLSKPLKPGDTTTLSFQFVSKLPKTIARSGYASNEFFHFVHWYPKLGVYEQDTSGNWGWNCHQFLPRMEFYGDFGNYDVTLEVPDRFIIGASGCSDGEEPLEEGYKRLRYIAHDVIDFAWCASPLLEVVEDRWKHVDIRMLSAKAHAGLRPRLIEAAKNSLTYLEDHVGEYPYSTLTILDPPMHGLRSGFMEYPTYITGGAFYNWPAGVRSIESLIIHELSHQYYMQMLASNEKEEPWLDEGFVTFSEDRIMEAFYGEENSLIDILGYTAGNSDFTRNEYVNSLHYNNSPIATHSWKFRGGFKETIYAKTATVLQTLRLHLGDDDFDKMMKRYFENNKFSHPRRSDFVKQVKLAFQENENILSPYISEFLIQALDSTTHIDYSVQTVNTSTGSGIDREHSIVIQRLGGFIVPVEIRVTWSDGSMTTEIWDGRLDSIDYKYSSAMEIVMVEIDPDGKLPLDINCNNNSYIVHPPKAGVVKYATKALTWTQHLFQTASFLF